MCERDGGERVEGREFEENENERRKGAHVDFLSKFIFPRPIITSLPTERNSNRNKKSTNRKRNKKRKIMFNRS